LRRVTSRFVEIEEDGGVTIGQLVLRAEVVRAVQPAAIADEVWLADDHATRARDMLDR
jgi:hypothetical protein